MIKYETHGGAESAGMQLERIRFYEDRMKEMDAERRKNDENQTGEEQVQK